MCRCCHNIQRTEKTFRTLQRSQWSFHIMCSQYNISIIGINKAITYWAIYQFATQRYTASEDIVAWYQLSWVQSLNQMYGKYILTYDNSLISNRGNESWQLICHQWSVELSHRWLPEVNIHLIAHWMLVVCLSMWVVWPGCQCVTLSLSCVTVPKKILFARSILMYVCGVTMAAWWAPIIPIIRKTHGGRISAGYFSLS